MSKGSVLQKIWDNLPPERQQQIKARAAARIGEYRTFPAFRTDEEMEAFVDSADLSEYDFSDLRPTSLSVFAQKHGSG